MNVRLDAKQDLFEAGEDNGDEAVEQFVAAYREAAEREAEERGVEITVVTPDDDDYFYGGSSEEENEIWQAIHDRLHYINGEWI